MEAGSDFATKFWATVRRSTSRRAVLVHSNTTVSEKFVTGRFQGMSISTGDSFSALSARNAYYLVPHRVDSFSPFAYCRVVR